MNVVPFFSTLSWVEREFPVCVVSCSLSPLWSDAAILSSREMCNRSVLATDKALETLRKFSLLFASPETMIGATKWREKLINHPLCERIVTLAIDEAHSISKWYEWILQ